MKCETIPHTVRLTEREKNIIRELNKKGGKRTFSEIVRAALIMYGGTYGVKTDADGNVV
jgi:hypothetical protein